MFIGGLQKFTLLDYPGKVAATVFTMGCNFRCQFCHNPEIVDPKTIDYENRMREEDILEFLDSRKDDLDGICITGGEPTLQHGLAEFIKKIKEMGFLAKLDTNASYFAVVKNLADDDLVDYWAVDIKTSPRKYRIVTQKADVLNNLEKSLAEILASEKELELRTTVARGIVNLEDFREIAKWLKKIDPKIFSRICRYSIQNFRPGKTLAEGFRKVKPYSDEELERMASVIRKCCKNVVIVE